MAVKGDRRPPSARSCPGWGGRIWFSRRLQEEGSGWAMCTTAAAGKH